METVEPWPSGQPAPVSGNTRTLTARSTNTCLWIIAVRSAYTCPWTCAVRSADTCQINSLGIHLNQLCGTVRSQQSGAQSGHSSLGHSQATAVWATVRSQQFGALSGEAVWATVRSQQFGAQSSHRSLGHNQVTAVWGTVRPQQFGAVSYTHLTLPTSCCV